MALEVKEKEIATGSHSIDNEGKLSIEYVRVIQVLSTPRLGPLEAMQATGLVLGETYITPQETDLRATLRKLDVTGHETIHDVAGAIGSKTTLTATYTNEFSDPEELTAEISWDSAEIEVEVERDIDGELIVNALGEPVRGVKRTLTIPICRISRYELAASYNPVAMSYYANAVNQSAFTLPGGFSVPAKMAKAKNPKASGSSDSPYFKVDYEFQINPDLWKQITLNCSMNALDDDTDEKKPILIKGQPVTEPLPLDAGGYLLPDGDPPVFDEWDVCPSLDFSIFQFV